MMESSHPSPDVVSQDAARGHARRSISIFSRRGSETPQLPIRPLSSLLMYSFKSSNGSAREQNAWKRRVSRTSKKEDQVIVNQETTLHAVPLEIKTSPMTPLERVMMTLPNEEILNAIGKDTCSTKSSLPVLPASPEWNTIPRITYPQSPRSPKSCSDNSKIGVWRDGVALWDTQSPKPYHMDATPSRPPKSPSFGVAPLSNARPNLSVVIPRSKPSQMDLLPSRPRYSLPAILSDGSAVFDPALSPASYASDDFAVHPAFRNDKSFLENRPSNVPHGQMPNSARAGQLAASRSSTTSSTIVEEASDKSSSYSRNSSMTSVDEGEEFIQSGQGSTLKKPTVVIQSTDVTFSTQLAVVDCVQVVLAPVDSQSHSPPNPTLSEVVQDLHTHLGSIGENPSISAPDHFTPQDRAPTVPKKSRKREWRAPSLAAATLSTRSRLPSDVIERRLSVPSRIFAMEKNTPLKLTNDVRRSNSVRTADGKATGSAGPAESEMSLGSAQISLLQSAIASLGSIHGVQPALTPPSAKNAQVVLLHIMSHLDGWADLQAMSMINRGMRQVFKQNESALLHTVLRNKSPAAWELRKWSAVYFSSNMDGSASPSDCEHSSTSYIDGCRNDSRIIGELKHLILQRCRSFLRSETVAALSSANDANAQRFDDAFYRVWCFCKVFGCEKGREDDITGQLDWLRGGLLAHQQDCAATINMNLEFDMGGVLLNAPDHFALGNGGGLTASQLYDMTEIWNCLAALLAGYYGRIGQGRQYGVYSGVDVPIGSISEEEALLEEWMNHILTLGPSVVLELAKFSEDPSDAGFKCARFNGWTDWAFPCSGSSRSTFFREPVARLYEERLLAKAVSSDLEAKEKREMGRKRVASLAAEIRLARCSSQYKRLPLIDMANERPMSISSRRDSALSPHPPSSSTRAPEQHWPWSSRRVSPIIEHRVDTFNRLSVSSLEGVAEDTSDRAIAKIVALGYSSSQAKEALRLTDMGNGLRVDRAVDFLLRR